MSPRVFMFVAFCLCAAPAVAQERPSLPQADAALRKGARFFRQEVSASGGYLWRYSADLKLREGEGKASATTVWVQPPGTPSVGMAYLEAHRRTGHEYLLDAARDAAQALVRGQLVSGGWDYRIEFDPKDRRRYAYRVDRADGAEPSVQKLRNTTTLDDNTTQSAVRFLMLVDQTLQFRDAAIHEAARYALDKLLEAQYPNGAWPQRFDGPPNAAQHPVKRASYPESWPRAFPGGDYRAHYTLNDNALADTIALMFDAADVYDDDRLRAAARRGGDFLLLAQMPDPQPAWAQQHDAQMHPAWARRFEPPSITGGESQRVLSTLLEIYRRTGDKKYLEPIPRALAYLKNSRLPDGRLARFYELQTNRPLYFTREYELTYNDDDLPTHYAFQVGARLDGVETQYRRLVESGPPRPRERTADKPRLTDALAQQAQAVIAQMDDRGAWVEAGSLSRDDAGDVKRIIDTRTFIKNLDTLSRYVQAAQP